MTDEKLINILERIAVALETIAGKETVKNSIIDSSNEQVLEQPEMTNEIVNEQVIQVNDINPILRFLTERNIQVKTFQTDEEIDDVLDNIALFMGNRYNRIKKVYNLIKSKLNSGTGFRLDLKNATQEEVSYSCQLCNSLHQIAFLSEYKYFKSPQFLINAKPNKIPTAIKFFTGQWLERFIKTEVKNTIRKLERPVKFAYLTNPQIILPNGDDFELDVLFYIEDEIFWFEAKTGEYQNYVDKYSRMAKLMQLDSKHAFMVLTEVNEPNCIALKKVFGMEVVNIESFSDKFQNAINHLNEEKNAL
ncbi:MAG: hypothetical protein KatS3mg028_1344 [Bacteroidia bacterium]|nr:MAG: hypothetical protein KatS3mg028_1344 [Bacteroidia bacterium]